MTTPEDRPYTIAEELRALAFVTKRVERMSPAGRRWLAEWLAGRAEKASDDG